jgi:hypothetical protein
MPRLAPSSFSSSLGALGQKNLRHFELLHDAVIHFADRHERRLRRHVDRGTVRGIPNFLHILVTIVQLLLSQIERVIMALEAEPELRISTERWFDFRQNLNDYFVRLRSLLQLTAREYVPAMSEAGSPNETRAAFAEGLPNLLALIETSTTRRDRLNALVEGRLRIETSAGTTKAQFFQECLATKKWPAMQREFGLLKQELGRLAV